MNTYDPGIQNTKPGQACRIITIQLVVPADADSDAISDEISELLTGAVCAGSLDPAASFILDWRYPSEFWPTVTASEEPFEGEIFERPVQP